MCFGAASATLATSELIASKALDAMAQTDCAPMGGTNIVLKKLLVLCALLMSSACASITAGTTQSVAVNTTPKDGAQCELKNEKGAWTVASTPGSTTVTKAYGELAITCAHPDGSKGATSMQSTTAGAAFGNILAGGLIGAAVDMSSGAAYQYPANVAVPLAPPANAPPAITPVAAPPPGRLGKDEAEAALKDLASLKQKKLIPEEEYQNRVREILARM